MHRIEPRLAEGVLIRDESPKDSDAIGAVVAAAFGSAAEASLVADLRAAGALSLSLVATADQAVVGHLALSPVTVGGADGDGRWLGLGPVAVAPKRQRGGIGRALVEEAMVRAAAGGAELVFVLGSSRYYRALGFAAAAEHGWRCDYPAGPEAFRVRRLAAGAEAPSGLVLYHAAFAQL